MPRQVIDTVGTTDSLQSAGNKINAMTNELYSLPSATAASGKMPLADAQGKIDAAWIDFSPALEVVYRFNPYDMVLKFNTALGDASNTITIPSSGGTHNFTIDWGDGNVSVPITTATQADRTHTYATGGIYTVKIHGACSNVYFYLAANTSAAKLIEVLNIGATGLTSCTSAFQACANLTTVSSVIADTSSVTNMAIMFHSCSSLTTLDVSLWDTSSVTAMNNMFPNCSSLNTLDVSAWDISSVTNMGAMFSNCTSLATLDVSSWDTSAVTAMTNMFYNCTSLTTLDVSLWDTSAVINMGAMFQGCGATLSGLVIHNWSVSNVTTAINFMLGANNAINTAEYDLALLAFDALPSVKPSSWYFGSTPYTIATSGAARASLVSKGWTITDGGGI